MEFLIIILVGLLVLSVFIEAILGLCAFFIPKDVRADIAKWFGYLMVANGAFVGWTIGGWIGDGVGAKLIGTAIGGLLFIGLIKRKEEQDQN